MMKAATKITAAAAACAFCAMMAGGAAYAMAPAEAEATPTTEAARAEATQSVTEGYAANANLLTAAGITEDTTASEATIEAAPETTAETAAPEAVVETAPAPAPEPAAPVLYPMSLEIAGEVIPYVDYYGASSAPVSTGGIWMGSDSTTDGSWGYFIGHHPGVFNSVMYLTAGDQVSVCDRNGNTATYTVFSVYDIPNTTYFEELEPYIEGNGESIVLQTCYGDGHTYRVVQAK